MELVPVAGGNSLTLSSGPPRVLGRAADCALPVYDASISRAHAELSLAPEGLRIRDLGSTNGVQVNGARIQEHIVREGDTVTFGAVSFRVSRAPAPAAAPQPAAPPPAAPQPAAPQPAPDPSPPRVPPTPEPQVRARLPVGIAKYTTQAAGPGEEGAAFLELLGGASPDETARKAAALLAIGTALAQAGDTGGLFEQVVQQGFEVLKADRASLMTVEGEDLALEPRATRRRPAQAEAAPIPRSLLYQALTEGVALLSADVGADERFEGKSARQLHGRSALCVPLVGDQRQVLGLLYLEREGGRRPFLEEDLRFMVAFANIAGLALQNQRLRAGALAEDRALARWRSYLSPNLDLAILGAEEAWSEVDQRKVAVLVGELRGVSELVAQVPAAELGALLVAFHGLCADAVFQCGGSLNSVRGGSLLAVWGAPFAAANDADRALRAAAAISSAVAGWNRGRGQASGRHLEIGVGLESGTAFVGGIGAGGRRSYTVAGQPLDTATRLAAAAEPGEVLLGEELCDALGNRPRLDRIKRPELRGLAAWRLVNNPDR